VDDRATTLLMTEFYRSLLEGNDMEKSLERSRLKVKGEHPSPEDWGAFVLLY
jgi:CHAT domain-containing protein